MGRDLQRYEKLIDEKERLISHYVIGQAEEKHLPIGETLSLAEDLLTRKPAPITIAETEQKEPPSVTIGGSDDRYVQMKVRVTEWEKNQILANMKRAEFENFNTYARKMLLDGYIIHWDYEDALSSHLSLHLCKFILFSRNNPCKTVGMRVS